MRIWASHRLVRCYVERLSSGLGSSASAHTGYREHALSALGVGFRATQFRVEGLGTCRVEGWSASGFLGKPEGSQFCLFGFFGGLGL